MGVMTVRPLNVDERFIMELREGNGSTRTLICDSKRCDRMADGVYHVGVHFVEDAAASSLAD